MSNARTVTYFIPPGRDPNTGLFLPILITQANLTAQRVVVRNLSREGFLRLSYEDVILMQAGGVFEATATYVLPLGAVDTFFVMPSQRLYAAGSGGPANLAVAISDVIPPVSRQL